MTNRVRVHALTAGIVLAMAASAGVADDGRYIVQFEDGVSPALAAKSLAGKASRIHHQFEEQGTLALSLNKEQLAALRNDPRVKSIEPDPRRYPMAQTTPYGISMVQAPTAWANGATGAGVMVCVIDSGINPSHEDFAGVNIAGGYPSNWNSDTCGHGTHVAGTINAANNATGVVGVSPGAASLYIVRVFSGGADGCGWAYSSDLVDAANRCKTAADAAGKKLVINMSLGGSSSSNAEQNGFQNLYNQGVLSIAAAGNDGNTALSYPASYSSVVSVAAIDSNKALASFSQRNAQVELAAPGVGILSTMPGTDGSLSVSGSSYMVASMTGTYRGSASGPLVNGGRCAATNSGWSGRVVLCERGDISFAEKMANVQASGGRAAVIYNNVAGNFGGTVEGTSSSIPTISASQEDGQYLVANRIGQTATVSTVITNPASGYGTMDGTSMATPHVAGAAAVVWSKNLNASNADVRNALTSTAEDLGTSGRDNSFGYGLIRVANAVNAISGPAPDTTPPSTPASLSATAGSSSAISLSWSAATDTGGSGLAGYKIERCSGASCSNFAQVATSTGTSYTDSGLTASTTYRYRVRAYDGAGNNGSYSSIAQATTQAAGGGGGGNVLANGVAVTGLSGATNAELRYTLVVPAGATNLKFITSGGSGDADLYVKFGSAPTTSSYDCRSWATGNNETCNINNAQAGTYHVLVRGYSAFSGLSLTGSYTASGGGGTAPSLFENTTDYTISDNATVESPITVSGRTGNAPNNLKVNVRIIHTYKGDLQVSLIGPNGATVSTLHNRTGGSTDNVIGTYTVNASSQPANGTWKLRVYDAASGDTGYIDSWSLQF